MQLIAIIPKEPWADDSDLPRTMVRVVIQGRFLGFLRLSGGATVITLREPGKKQQAIRIPPGCSYALESLEEEPDPGDVEALAPVEREPDPPGA